MKKLIIPRKDHEVYFIPVRGKIRNMGQYAAAQLEKLHPLFTSGTVVDIKKITVNKTKWIMATVMDESTIAEYRILNKNTAFYTNTSISVFKKGFAKNGINVIDDEYIGYDENKNEPVSVPVEGGVKAEKLSYKNNLMSIPYSHGVFNKKFRTNIKIGISAAVTVVLAISCIFIGQDKNTKVKTEEITFNLQNETDNKTDMISEVKYLPPCIELLAHISEDLYRAGGRIIQWQYNEETTPQLTIKIYGINTFGIYRIFSNYEYLFLQEFRDVTYTDDRPYITINVKINGAYSLPVKESFPVRNSILPVFDKLVKTLMQNDISIISEILPVSDTNDTYSIAYSTDDVNLLRSIDLFVNFCRENQLWIINQSISINNEKNNFLVSCTFVKCFGVNSISMPGSEKYYIPLVFDYVKETENELLTEVITEPTGISLIGIIRDDSSQITFMRDSVSGKIQAKENYE